MTLSYNLAYQEIILVHITSDLCWQTILYFLEHLRPSHISLEPIHQSQCNIKIIVGYKRKYSNLFSLDWSEVWDFLQAKRADISF